MRSKLVTAGLVAFLILGCAGLGLIFGSSPSGASPEGSGGGGSTASSSTSSELPPKLVIEVVSQGVIFVGASPPSHFGVAHPQSGSLNITVPIYQLVNVPSSVKFTLTLLTDTPVFFGHAPTYTVFTNSSGLGQAYLPQGNYSAEATSTSFNYTTMITMRQNTTTYLELSVTPTILGITSLSVSSPDGYLGIELGAQMFARVAGGFQYAPDSAYQVIGDFTETQLAAHGLLTIPVKVIGSYQSVGGTWVVLSPQGSYSSVPTSNLALVNYLANSTVRYSGY